jgi:hypothetical protein
MFDLKHLPQELVVSIRSFLSIHDYWGTDLLENVEWYHINGTFPQFYQKINLKETCGRRWRKCGNESSPERRTYYHRRQRESLMYKIQIVEEFDRTYYTLMIRSQWKAMMFTDDEMFDIDDYLYYKFPNVPTYANNEFVELIFYEPKNTFTKFDIHKSPRHLFQKLVKLVDEMHDEFFYNFKCIL